MSGTARVARGKKKASAKKKTSAKKKAPAETAPAAQQLDLAMDMGAPEPAPKLPDGPLKVGDAAPAFSLEADDGNTYSRDSLLGQRYVIYFYPRDNTPGCTTEACDFRDRGSKFSSAGVKVLGVSPDSLTSHGRFRAKYDLDFPLLADTDRQVATAFGALGEKNMYGKKRIGIIRSTFVVGTDGNIETVFSPVRVKGHADAVLQAIGD